MSQIYQSAEEIGAACRSVVALAPATYPPDLPSTPELREAPAWYKFEHAAWPIGEAIRQSFKQTPRLKRNAALLSAIVGVIECRNLRRGRQSFVMALAFKAAAPVAGRLVPFLADPDIDGQVVDTLLKMRAGGYAQQVRPLMNANHAWIRSLARQYLARYPAAA